MCDGRDIGRDRGKGKDEGGLGRTEPAKSRTKRIPLIPAKAGTQAFSPELMIQITPARIEPLDQLDLPGPIPFLEPPLAPKGILAALEGLEPHQLGHAIFGGEAPPGLFPMFPNSPRQAIGRTDVERSVAITRDDVDAKGQAKKPGSPLSRG